MAKRYAAFASCSTDDTCSIDPLFEVVATSEEEALAVAKAHDPRTVRVEPMQSDD